VRRILSLAGYQIRTGLPGPGDLVGVWGKRPTAKRGEAMASRANVPVLRVEDAFLRSLHPGRAGDAPLGLLLDQKGIHFDGKAPSDLEDLLNFGELDDPGLLSRAEDAIARIKAAHLTKYSAVEPEAEVPRPGYVLVIDQTRGDASVPRDTSIFKKMLEAALTNHPEASVVIKSHPETQRGLRPGHYPPSVASDRVTFLDTPVSPWALFEGAIAVYTVSSQLGFEAICAGHRPVVFGQPFYAGWGLTTDQMPLPRRVRQLSEAQLFAGAMILYPLWYDPYRDQLCRLEEVIDTLEAQSRAWREDHLGSVALGMRLWKRGHLRRFLRDGPVRFPTTAPPATHKARLLSWGMSAPNINSIRVEDGFLRSRGLGAELVPPLSLAFDDLGMYYDPRSESRLDRLIAAPKTPAQLDRARRLVRKLVASNVTKYNLDGSAPLLPQGHKVLVVGQVEDDASVVLGCAEPYTNRTLLEKVRTSRPESTLIFKPHPDVEAGLRRGADPSASTIADIVASKAEPTALINEVDEVWTLTSLLGFEALIRGKPVTCLGMPFYAGWGLTTDHAPQPAHRSARPDLLSLVYAALIAYPRYHDPVTGRACPVEVAVDRLISGQTGPQNRALSKLQGLFASTPFWR